MAARTDDMRGRIVAAPRLLPRPNALLKVGDDLLGYAVENASFAIVLHKRPPYEKAPHSDSHAGRG